MIQFLPLAYFQIFLYLPLAYLKLQTKGGAHCFFFFFVDTHSFPVLLFFNSVFNVNMAIIFSVIHKQIWLVQSLSHMSAS